MTQLKKDIHVIEKKQIFSKSKIWQYQRKYFKNAGIDAWLKGEVPHYITSNPVMGKTYAEIVLAFLRDIALQKKTIDTVYLLELGAGHGRLCYHFMKYFIEFYASTSFELPEFCYILSDFTEDTLNFWQNSPRLQPFFERGILDVALFDAEADKELYLRYSGITINKESLEQPLIVIANYFFDTIPQELFYIKDNQIYECLLTLGTEEDPSLMDSSELIDHIILEYDYNKTDKNKYKESYLSSILSYYSCELSDTHILFPYIGIQCLENLRKLSRQGLMLITSDKGSHRIDDLENRNAPDISRHGSFSLTVNYNAFKLYCENSYGYALFPKHYHFNIDLCCLLFFEKPVEYKETFMAYERFIINYGSDDYFSLKKLIEKHFSTLNFRDIFSILKLSGYDARLFNQMLPQLFYLLPGITENERWAIFQIIHKIWDMYFPLGEEDDLAFNLGMLLCELKFYTEAIVYFKLSEKIYESSEYHKNNIALCYYYMNEKERALSILQKTNDSVPLN